jgi:hypothetical protein
MGEMRMTRLDPETAHRLLDGHVAPDDAPPGFSGVAALFDAARGITSEPGSVDQASTVAAMQAVVLERLDSPTIDPRRRNVRKKVLAAKTAAATTVVLLGAGTAAAATGSLPGAAQSTASDMLSKIGVSVPGNNNDHANTRGQSGDTGTTGPSADTGTTGSSNRQGNGPNSHAFPGLCRAQIASAPHPNSNSVVPGINCANVTPAGGGSTTDTSGTSGTDQPSGTPDSTPAGPPSSTPPVSTPDHGTADTSSGTNGSTGLGTAATHDGGASSAGGGNSGSRP